MQPGIPVTSMPQFGLLALSAFIIFSLPSGSTAPLESWSVGRI